MKLRRISAVAGTFAALGLITAGPSLAATKVSVRVEGSKKTLLPATTVTVPSRGSVKRGSGSCPANSGAGALNVATKGNFGGTYSSGLGIEVTKILGESAIYTKTNSYWELFANNRPSEVGICDLKPKAGEQLLFAAVPAKGTAYPLVVTAPKTATTGKRFKVKAFYYKGTGSKETPVAGVTFKGQSSKTNAKGVATLTITHAGKVSLVGSAKGYIRSAADTVKAAPAA